MLFNLAAVSQVAFMDMNEVHFEELTLANDLYQYLSTTGPQNIDHQHIESLLSEFAFHVRDHFLFEEDMMRESNCPILGCHETEHKRVQKLMFEIFKDYALSKDVELLKAYFEFEFKSWIENHILTMDTVTAIYLNDYSQKSEQL